MPVDTRTWRGRDGVALCIVVVVAAALRFAGVTSPNTLYFDEYHYARQACFLAWDTSACGFEETRRPVHPPLARRLIALGIRALGNNPLGWRVAPALAGTLSVVLLYLLARRLLGSTAAAVTASGLLAVDALHFIHSRLAMLDIFVALFVLAAALFCAYDRGQVLSGRPHASPAWFSSLLGHRWRVAAGAAVGAAAACKWPGAFVLLAIVPLTLGWELATRRDRGLKAALVGVFREESVSFIVSFMLVPALAYAAAHVGTVRGVLLAWPWSEGSWLRAFVDEQVFFY
ncbi:MAG: phospholipid carrier-dependent glycosyltransferase, partial [Armatimonadota bacterium]|nr:phospholipid carrier-dependent glycosyltransferase [Armatimonadota bacterium]